MNQTPQRVGRTICLFGDSGSGKTTQFGELAKRQYKLTGRKSLLNAMDKGGYGSIDPHVSVGIIQPHHMEEDDDPWMWITEAVEGRGIDDTIGLVGFDSGTSASENLLSSCAKLSAGGEDIGGRPAPKFVINKNAKGGAKRLQIGSNVDSHYLVVQGFMLDAIWRSTWLTRKGIDVVWTFGVHRGEKEDATAILGPKLAGKALTAAIPKWFNLTFMLSSIPVEGGQARHILSLQEQPGLGGMGVSFGNPRVPLEATTPVPAIIEPASLSTALDLLDAAKEEAEAAIRVELGI